MEDLLFIVPLALVIAVLLAPRRARTAPPGERAPVARSMPAPMVRLDKPPFLVLLLSLIGRDLARLRIVAREGWRGLVTSFRMELAPPRPRLADTTMSSDDRVTTFDDLDAEVLAREKQETATGNAETPARNTDDAPEYIIPPERLKALETLYKGGLSAFDLERLQAGEPEVIRLANKVAPRRVLAKAMGGGTKRRMEEIAAALQEGESHAG